MERVRNSESFSDDIKVAPVLVEHGMKTKIKHRNINKIKEKIEKKIKEKIENRIKEKIKNKIKEKIKTKIKHKMKIKNKKTTVANPEGGKGGHGTPPPFIDNMHVSYSIQEHSYIVCPLPHEQQIVAHLEAFLNDFCRLLALEPNRLLRTRHFRS